MASEGTAPLPPAEEPPQSTEAAALTPESAYHDLRRLIPPLAAELENLRTSLPGAQLVAAAVWPQHQRAGRPGRPASPRARAGTGSTVRS